MTEVPCLASRGSPSVSGSSSAGILREKEVLIGVSLDLGISSTHHVAVQMKIMLYCEFIPVL